MNRDVLEKNYGKHGFQTSFFQTKEEATAYLAGELKGRQIAFGGSITVQEMGLYDVLSQDNEVIWHWITPGGETLRKAREAEIYICSANGASETGELVNIDGGGNRIAQSIYGPKKVYYIVGKNKVCPDLAGALHRAKHVAAPKNAMRLNRKTPCVASGGERCFDCSSPERICNVTAVIDHPSMGMKAEVVFIDEELGY